MVNERMGDSDVVAISWFGSALVMLGFVELVGGMFGDQRRAVGARR